MEFERLSEIMRECGVVGAGGAGFPSYAKLNATADTLILNCAECEPLFKLHRQLLARFAKEILTALEEIADTIGATSVIVAIKPAYTEALDAIGAELKHFKKTKIKLLPEIYPAGDEVVTIYQTTGRVVAPGALPITVGCIVYNVETVYNIYRALKENSPVIHKYIMVAGEVKNPCILRAPIGMTYGELIRLVGGKTCEDSVIIAGGPMTGRISSDCDVVTKTSNAVLVMPRDSYIVSKRLTPVTISTKRAMAACCQCRMCTDLCSRNLLGQPIEPHKIMRAVASGVADSKVFLNAFSCSSCGLCEMFSCGQGLNPRSIIDGIKAELRKNGIAPQKGLAAGEVSKDIEYRQVPMSRLVSRMGLKKYDLNTPIVDVELTCDSVKIPLLQGIGAPCAAAVKKGDSVKAGDLIGAYAKEKLGAAVHASLDGRVREITDTYVVIEN